MWAIKILNGPEAGRIVQLEMGTHSIGRSHHVDIKVASQTVSKVHAQLLVTADKLIISDTQSSNGVFVNGIKIKNQVLKSGDKFSLSDVLFDTIKLPPNVQLVPIIQRQLNNSLATGGQRQNGLNTYNLEGNAALNANPLNNAPPELAELPSGPTGAITTFEKIDRYIDQVALPSVYKFADKYDLKYVVAAFVIIFVILVTTLTILPVVQISRDFIVDESRRRAESLTRLLVLSNREYLVSGNEVNVSVDLVMKEPGVDQAFVIAASDGHIIAPLRSRGGYSDIPFLQEARKKASRYHKVMENKIGVSLPILQHNDMTGEPTAIAYAIILYNMDKVALDIERALGLIIQILLITIVAGSVLYFFLYRIIMRPLYVLNREIDMALKQGEQGLQINSPTPIMQRIVANINSALSRMGSETTDEPAVNLGDKTMEAVEIVHMFPVAALAFSAETEMIVATNDYFNGHPLFDNGDLLEKYVEDLTDQSLIESIRDLIGKARDNPNLRHTNILPTQGGQRFEITVKAIQDNHKISYFLVSFTEMYDDEGNDE